MADVTDARMQRLVDAFLAESRLIGTVELDERVAYGIVSQLVRATCEDKGVTIDSALDDHLSVEAVKGLVRLGAAKAQEGFGPSTRDVAIPARLCGDVVSGLGEVVTRTTRAAADYSVPLHRATGTLLAAARTLTAFGEALRRSVRGAVAQSPGHRESVIVPLGDVREAVTVLDACAVVITAALPLGRRADEAAAQELAVALQRTARELAEIDDPPALAR